MSSIEVRKVGVKFKPAALVVSYKRGTSMRRRTIPVRNISKDSNVSDVVDDLKRSDKHRRYLDGVSSLQLLKMLGLIKDNLNGMTLDESLDRVKQMETIDSDEDLNKADQDTLNMKKAAMDEVFQQNQVKPSDPEFQYDIQVDFGTNDAVETLNWSDDDDFEF